MKKKQNLDNDRKHRFCDPGACHCCEDQGGGNFYCRYAKVMVVENWQNTEHAKICKRGTSDMGKPKTYGATKNAPQKRDKHDLRYQRKMQEQKTVGKKKDYRGRGDNR